MKKAAPVKVRRPSPAPVKPVASDEAPCETCGSVYFPTGERETSAIFLTKCAPSEVQVGINFNYAITVTNLTSKTLRNVVVTDELAENYELSKSVPAVTDKKGRYARWALGDMEANRNGTNSWCTSSPVASRLAINHANRC